MKKLDNILIITTLFLALFSFALFLVLTETEGTTIRGIIAGSVFFILLIVLILLAEKSMKEEE